MVQGYVRNAWLGLGGVTALIVGGAQAFAMPSVFPTGVTLHDPEAAYQGYVLFPGSDQNTHLIDMDGNEVHRWAYRSFPPVPLTPEQADGERGRLLVQSGRVDTPKGPSGPGNGLTNASIAEVDWSGAKHWTWGTQDAPAAQHHDMSRLPNGNTLLLSAKARHLPGFAVPEVVDNDIVEVRPDGSVAWRWKASEHLEQMGFSREALSRLKASDDPDFLHLNTVTPLGPNQWFDDGDARFAPDNLMVNARNANVAFIVDRKTGDIVWRLGPDFEQTRASTSRTLPRPVDQLIGAHDVHLIPKGLPGAGNLLIFDNQGNAGFPPADQSIFSFSRVLEVNPRTKEIVWLYTADQSGREAWSFYSAFISSAQRLPNGNTLIDEGQDGRLFQVTPKGRIVWEYVSPFFGKSEPDNTYVTNGVYRAELLDYDWAPKGTPHASHAVTPQCTPTRQVLDCTRP
ncbi:aryl-sulfate sulfotransferase [Larsenimonas salina]|uniref:aryl-sulfate sulfotransferase n=1 Tax=Larsenimonas salina TaxID=1295565 RepID=UPI002073D8EA|nr:aryl-sulfate sulfotransferase [Larsenimonas salina]MCM5705143.1 aryl-sulfate sulfotransferase [Larsenimonas salina]